MRQLVGAVELRGALHRQAARDTAVAPAQLEGVQRRVHDRDHGEEDARRGPLEAEHVGEQDLGDEESPGLEAHRLLPQRARRVDLRRAVDLHSMAYSRSEGRKGESGRMRMGGVTD